LEAVRHGPGPAGGLIWLAEGGSEGRCAALHGRPALRDGAGCGAVVAGRRTCMSAPGTGTRTGHRGRGQDQAPVGVDNGMVTGG